MIERYLAELADRLPRLLFRRRRVLAEVEDHLREAAAKSSEAEAVVRFGPAHDVAAGFRADHAARTALLAVAGLLAYPILSYPVIENSLPPAPWSGDRPPDYLRWKQDAMIYLFLLAIPPATAALVVLRRSRSAAFAFGAVALAAMSVHAVLAVVLAAQWPDAVPGTPVWLTLVAVLEAALVVAAAGLLVRARVLVLASGP